MSLSLSLCLSIGVPGCFKRSISAIRVLETADFQSRWHARSPPGKFRFWIRPSSGSPMEIWYVLRDGPGNRTPRQDDPGRFDQHPIQQSWMIVNDCGQGATLQSFWAFTGVNVLYRLYSLDSTLNRAYKAVGFTVHAGFASSSVGYLRTGNRTADRRRGLGTPKRRGERPGGFF